MCGLFVLFFCFRLFPSDCYVIVANPPRTHRRNLSFEYMNTISKGLAARLDPKISELKRLMLVESMSMTGTGWKLYIHQKCISSKLVYIDIFQRPNSASKKAHHCPGTPCEGAFLEACTGDASPRLVCAAQAARRNETSLLCIEKYSESCKKAL